ncbi:MAG TPA: M48 family metallopeptidase [Burkholderiaceae bacterium]|nr:M48 family metallopeptidase [Burkholderiaceae bacterium]
MDFFEHQDQARRRTRRLILLFVLALVATVVAVNLAGLIVFKSAGLPLPRHFYLTNTLVTLMFILGGSAWEIARLREGGEAVARSVGGRRIDAGSADPAERRLLNVVEEMALASGIPVPRVFVLEREEAINAFAAGWSVNDAVVAVTHGALTRLNRQELQGVVAHEFSHILNGDMRLNLRLMGVVFGLLMLSMFGRFLLQLGGRGSSGGGDGKAATGVALVALAGFALWLIGFVGVFFGRLIKAGVSRNREYLADASAVQFTREVEGIGGALRKIGGLAEGREPGSRIGHPAAESLSHLFLGPALRALADGAFATHPPLADRVKRLYGRPMPWLAAPPESSFAAPPAAGRELPPLDFAPAAAPVPAGISPVAALAAAQAEPALAAPALALAVGTVAPPRGDFDLDEAQSRLLAGLHQSLQQPEDARLAMLALVIDKAEAPDPAQRALVAQTFGAPAAARVAELHGAIAKLPPGTRLPMADLAAPALLRLPAQEREGLLMCAHGLIHADGRVTLPEFLLYTVLKRRLAPGAAAPVPVRHRAVAELPAEASLVLSLVAALRLPDAPERAFGEAAAFLPGVALALVPAPQIRLDALTAAFERLNQLAPLAKPALIKAATAVAFVDEQTRWRAASALRTLAIALDAPLPPRLAALTPIGEAAPRAA